MDNQLLSAIYLISKEATKVALSESGLITPLISKKEACKEFTPAIIKRLVDSRKLHPIKTGDNTSKIMFRREELAKAMIDTYASQLPGEHIGRLSSSGQG